MLSHLVSCTDFFLFLRLVSAKDRLDKILEISRAREIATDALLMETSAGSSAQNHEPTGKKLISFDLIFNWH